MNATASDLKAAYVQYTRAAIILDEILRQRGDFTEFKAQNPEVYDVPIS